jgi:hypothetical protein
MVNKKKLYILMIIGIVLIGITSININLQKKIFKDNFSEINYQRANTLQNANGIITNIWLNNNSKLDKFKKNNIQYLFVDIGEINKKGEIKTNPLEIENFLKFIEKYENKTKYNFILLPYHEINTRLYDINSIEFQNNFVKDYVLLEKMGFDGILVDIEYLPEDKEIGYLKILDALNQNLSKKSIIAAYTVGIRENKNYWEWSPEFFKKVIEMVDLIEFGAYDTMEENNEKYQEQISSQIKIFAEKDWNTYFIFIVPTHRQYPETIENSLKLFNSEIKKYPKNKFIGTGIFAEWTTNNSEWEIFEKYNFLPLFLSICNKKIYSLI